MTAHNDFKWKQCRFRLAVRKKYLYNEGDDTPKQVVQRNFGRPIPESVRVRMDKDLSNLI